MWCRIGNWFANILCHLLFYKESIWLRKICDMCGRGIFQTTSFKPHSFKQVWALKESLFPPPPSSPKRHGAFLEWGPHIWAQQVLPKFKILVLLGKPPMRHELRRVGNPCTAVRCFQLSNSLSCCGVGDLGVLNAASRPLCVVAQLVLGRGQA